MHWITRVVIDVIALWTLMLLSCLAVRADTSRCEALLPGMRTVIQTQRQGFTLTEDQQALWRQWNAECAAAAWQQQLAQGLPPVRRERSWRVDPPVSPRTPMIITRCEHWGMLGTRCYTYDN